VLIQTSFEDIVEELGLSPEEYETSVLLKQWVRQNMNKKYVPSGLLKAWGFVEEERKRCEAA